MIQGLPRGRQEAFSWRCCSSSQPLHGRRCAAWPRLTVEVKELRPAKLTLDKLGANRRNFYRWYDRYLEYGEGGLDDLNGARTWPCHLVWCFLGSNKIEG